MEELEPAEAVKEVVGSIDALTAPAREFVAGIPALLIGASAMVIGVLLCLGLNWLVRRALLRATRGAESGFLHEVVRRTGGLSRLAAVLVGMIVTLPATNLPDEWISLVRHAISIMLIVLVGWALMSTVSHTADRSLRRWMGADEENVEARKNRTQIRVFRQVTNIMVFMITAGACLLTFDGVREYGAGLFASAGVAGIVAAVAARPVLANIFAGLQIAITQPMRIDDVVIVEGEWGWIEEITATYVVVRIWDWRRLVLPISYFVDKPFQNWTRNHAELIGSVYLYVDYTLPLAPLREALDRILEEEAVAALWDGQVKVIQVVDASERTMSLRVLVSAVDAPTAWDLRCAVRERLIAFIQSEYPDHLPRLRAEMDPPQGLNSAP